VPRGYKTADGYSLDHWVNNVRAKYVKMTAERKALLDALGFIWDPFFDQWEEGYLHLKSFVEEHGNCRVPSGYKCTDGFRLRVWVDIRRAHRDEMSRERKARLDALGFVWDVKSEMWEEGYLHLKSFVEEHGNCRVPVGCKCTDGYRLGHWVNNARARRNAMAVERIARLDALGFIWDPLVEQWDEGYRHLKAFVEEKSHCQVAQLYKSADGYRLGVWVNSMRQKQSELSSERRARLDALGFVWDPHFDQWEEGYRHLKAFVEEKSHCQVAQRYKSPDGYRLGGLGQ
jgi:hypothetical protein